MKVKLLKTILLLGTFTTPALLIVSCGTKESKQAENLVIRFYKWVIANYPDEFDAYNDKTDLFNARPFDVHSLTLLEIYATNNKC